MLAGVWYGTDAEKTALLSAIAHNCACTWDGDDYQSASCGAHGLLTTGQSVLDHLIFARRLAPWWRRGEWAGATGTGPTLDQVLHTDEDT